MTLGPWCRDSMSIDKVLLIWVLFRRSQNVHLSMCDLVQLDYI